QGYSAQNLPLWARSACFAWACKKKVRPVRCLNGMCNSAQAVDTTSSTACALASELETWIFQACSGQWAPGYVQKVHGPTSWLLHSGGTPNGRYRFPGSPKSHDS